jgi:hypothetical protein
MKAKKIVKLINLMDENELIQLNNTYCQNISSEDEVWTNDEEFFNLFFENKTNEALRAAHFGDYNWSHNYVKFNGYGNLESFDYFEVKDLCESPEVMAEYIEENFNDFEFLFN